MHVCSILWGLKNESVSGGFGGLKEVTFPSAFINK